MAQSIQAGLAPLGVARMACAPCAAKRSMMSSSHAKSY
ncbi:hypothetical protein CGLO_14011 [Colletotrichum gloeosporioides Cg-14]|uniref:Uncharacterized protein n=1 Tax=Colletotrichum gloeosporioides (strain Cg-14) TaxID=1237896 RepID=T0LET8_COLGC|nr:hypothetical protein CGLO_14011 [Colletotrichum gloeosporioides Cg-14]